MKKKIYSLLALCLLSFGMAQAAEIYGVFSNNNQLLTLYYDNNKSSRGGLSPNEWGTTAHMDARDAVEKVIFTASMQNALPTSTQYWFNGFDSLKTIENLDYLNTSEVTNMYSMFHSCQALQSIDLSHFNTSKVTSMGLMFSGCKKLKELDLTGFDVAQVTNMENMFDSDFSLTTIYCNDDWSLYTNKGNPSMFKNCTKLEGGMGCVYNPNEVTINRARPDRLTKRGYFTEKYPTPVPNKCEVTVTGDFDDVVHSQINTAQFSLYGRIDLGFFTDEYIYFDEEGQLVTENNATGKAYIVSIYPERLNSLYGMYDLDDESGIIIVEDGDIKSFDKCISGDVIIDVNEEKTAYAVVCTMKMSATETLTGVISDVCADEIDPSQDIDRINQEPKAKSDKFIRDGQLLIIRDGKTYNAQGALIDN